VYPLDVCQLLAVVERTDLVVPVLGVVQPYLSHFGFFSGQGIGDVVEDVEVFVGVAQRIVGLAPNQPVSAEFEHFFTCPVYHKRSIDDIRRVSGRVLSQWAEFVLVLLQIKATELIVLSRISKREYLLVLAK